MSTPLDDMAPGAREALLALRDLHLPAEVLEMVALAASGLAVARIESEMRSHGQARVTALTAEVRRLRAEISRLRQHSPTG
jgi:hypothetical protein